MCVYRKKRIDKTGNKNGKINEQIIYDKLNYAKAIRKRTAKGDSSKRKIENSN